MTPPDNLPELEGHYRLRPDKVILVNPDDGELFYRWHDYVVALRPCGPLNYRSEFGERLTFRRNDARGALELHLTDAQGRSQIAPRVALVDQEECDVSRGGVALRGTLLFPKTPGPHPAVVLVHGSGAHTRDWYRLTADHFARAGIAALVYDKRGAGSSGGDYFDSTYDDLANDSAAWVALLRGHPRIDPRLVGVWGVSEGAWVVCLTASWTPEVAFVICKSGAGMSPAEQELFRRVIWPMRQGRPWPGSVASALSYAAFRQLLRSVPARQLPVGRWMLLGNIRGATPEG